MPQPTDWLALFIQYFSWRSHDWVNTSFFFFFDIYVWYPLKSINSTSIVEFDSGLCSGNLILCPLWYGWCDGWMVGWLDVAVWSVISSEICVWGFKHIYIPTISYMLESVVPHHSHHRTRQSDDDDAGDCDCVTSIDHLIFEHVMAADVSMTCCHCHLCSRKKQKKKKKQIKR